jgi:hypothetical protein
VNSHRSEVFVGATAKTQQKRPLETSLNAKVVHACVLEHDEKELVGLHDLKTSQARFMSGMLCHREFHRVDGESRNPTSKDTGFFRRLAGGVV